LEEEEYILPLSALSTCDLFGGTGSITYELISRGARECTIVEKDNTMYAFIKKTAQELNLQNIRIIRSDVFKFIQQCQDKFGFIFAGPPYALETIDLLPVKIREQNMLEPGGWFVLEHTPRNDYTASPQFVTSRNYGTTVFSIFVNK
jgi:16S rRNA G966 N2-methylase RsmD